MASFERTAVVGAPISEVWDRIISPEGINDEMAPWMSMRIPKSVRGLTVDSLPVGQVLGRAWILLFGVIPIDYDRLAIVELDPGRYFHEKSTMLSMRRWEHQRSLRSIDDRTTEITDRITFEPRLSFLGLLLVPLLRAFFGHRHRRLARHFAY